MLTDDFQRIFRANTKNIVCTEFLKSSAESSGSDDLFHSGKGERNKETDEKE